MRGLMWISINIGRSILLLKRQTYLLGILVLSGVLLAQSISKIGEIKTPEGYNRIEYETDSYPSFLRNLNLKEGKEILKWDGQVLPSSWALYDVMAVLDLPLLYNQDLEQCADFSMRLWSEYLKAENKLDQLALFDYNGNPKRFMDSGKSFKSYLQWHMAYSNSHSIKKGARKISPADLQPGDMFVQNESGEIGHVSVIVDAAENATGERVFLIGFGYMPAQEFHIEEAKNRLGHGGWFTLEGYLNFLDGLQFSHYGKPLLMRY